MKIQSVLRSNLRAALLGTRISQALIKSMVKGQLLVKKPSLGLIQQKFCVRC